MSSKEATESGELLVAFTSFPEERPLYGRDALNSIAYPEGWFLTLTYRDQWIEKKLGPLIDRTSKIPQRRPYPRLLPSRSNLLGRKVLIAFCPRDSRLGAIPLRYGHVARIEAQDPGSPRRLASIRLKLGRLPHRDLIGRFARRDIHLPLIPNPPTANSNFLTTWRDPWRLEESDWSTWEDIAKNLSSLIEFKDSKLFYLRRFRARRSSGTRRARAQPPATLVEDLDVTQLELFANRLYELEFYLFSGSVTGVMEHDCPQLSMKGDHIEFAESVVKQHGSGAVATYLLTVKRRYVKELATIVGRIPASTSQTPAPELQALLRLRPSLGFWPLTVALIMLGATLLNVDRDVLQAIGLQGEAHQVLIGKLLGGFFSGISAWVAFRRLPLKI